MRLLFAACFSVTLIVLVAIHGAESVTCDKTNVCSAIKPLKTKLEGLEAKLENLITLLSPPDKFGLTDRTLLRFVSFFLFVVPSVPAEFNFFHSCSRFCL